MTDPKKDLLKAYARLARITAQLGTTDVRPGAKLVELAREYADGLTKEMPLPEEDIERLVKEAVLPLFIAATLLNDFTKYRQSEVEL